MPRSNRPRGRRPDGNDDEVDLSTLFRGGRRSESRRGLTFAVQPIGPAAAAKDYVCPGCTQAIHPGTAHVVVWRADGVLGDAADLAARRHWHEHCWRIA